MNIGRLDRRLRIETATQTRDEWNHPVDTWETLATVWASRRDRRANEQTETNQTVGVSVVEWTIRHRDDITTDARVVDAYGGTYEIRGIQEVGRREGLRLITERRE